MRAEQIELQQAAYRPPAGEDRAPAEASSTASRPRPARPSRRRAGSRRWTAWRRSRRCWPMPNSASSSRNRRNLPNPMLAMDDAELRLPAADDAAAGTPPTSSCATSTARCWPASASASSAPTARASPRWSRPSPRDLQPHRRRRHRGQGPRPSATSRSRNWTCCARQTRRWST